MAANLTDAAAQTSQDVAVIAADNTQLLYTQLGLWLAALAALTPADTPGSRRVLNWIPVGRELQATLSTTWVSPSQSANQVNAVALYVWRTIKATIAAAGDLTNEATLLTAYNSIWE